MRPFIHLFTLTMQLIYAQNHLGLKLGKKLSFNRHTNNKISKATKSTNLLRKLQPILPRKGLLINCKSFTIPHFDYGDDIYDQLLNASF